MEAASVEPQGVSHHRVVDLYAGREAVLFFADDPADLPGDAVLRELRGAARLVRAGRTRGVLDALAEQLGTGIVGAVGAAMVSESLRATAGYLRRRRRPPQPAPLEQVVSRVRETCQILLGCVPTALSEPDLRRQEDGTWAVRFAHLGTTYLARVDQDGAIVQWTQTDQPEEPGN
ncbi:hypothetical protein ABT065_44790 [Streptomyces sp. NPDC002764]|uniref:hypothetical protein n=1 Tax=Streptomyces sp. NPDC002764 TaxID=3154428 RepID=UPI0033176F6F